MTARSEHTHHHFAGSEGADNEGRTLWAFAITFGFMVVEALGGWFAGSLALLADAAHMLTDSLALLLAWAAFRLGRMAADPRRTYGYRRLEVLAAFLNGLFVVGLALWIVWEAVERLGTAPPVMGLPMLVIAVVGLVVNALVLRVLHAGHSHGNLNMRGAMLHVLGDLVGSAAAVIAALIIIATGWTPIDPLLSMGVALLILINAWRLLSAATHILLEGAPEDFDEAAMRARLLAAVPDLRDVHHIHAWALTSGQPLLTMHATIAADADHDRALAAIKQELTKAFRMDHSVVQIERACPDEDIRCA